MSYILSSGQEATIKNYVDAFWDDFKFKIEGQKVIFYVDAWQGHMYFLDFGEFDNPQEVIQAIEDCPIYQNRSMVSAKRVVLGEIAKTPKYAT
jgi:hypothetical protein